VIGKLNEMKHKQGIGLVIISKKKLAQVTSAYDMIQFSAKWSSAEL
jgi:hypothetical protein